MDITVNSQHQLDDVLYGDGRVALLQGDVAEQASMIPDESIDGLLTDPPYFFKKYSYTYGLNYLMANRVLKYGGYLMMILPHYTMDPFGGRLSQTIPFNFLSETNLRYRWTLCMDQMEGPHPRLPNACRNIEVTWKPIGWWYKWPNPVKNYKQIRDSFRNKPPKKDAHKWQQSVSWAEYCLSFFEPGSIIVDPMMGAGTMIMAGLRLGYKVIGGDRDGEMVDYVKNLVEGVQ